MNRRNFLKITGACFAGPFLPRECKSRADSDIQNKGKISGRPNILLIMTDQQFADAMSCRMGRQFIHTPAMDGLASAGILFSRAYSANPLCMPLRNSLFTGRYPHETGVTSNDHSKGSLDPKEFPLMGTYFKKAGYETAYYGKWHICMDVKKPADHGFDNIDTRGSADTPTVDKAVAFLEQKHDKPFLLVASFVNPHNICEWSRRLAGRKQTLSCGEIGDPPSLEQLPPAPFNMAPPKNEPDGMSMMRRSYQVESGLFPVGKFTSEDWRRHRWGYYRMIEKVDGEIARLLDVLRKSGQEENTLIVFTSDHGDCAGAHRFNQKTVFYDESARVPLIMTWKGRIEPCVNEKLVNTGIDVLPTFLDAAGVSIPGKLPGHSLLPLATGTSAVDWPDYVTVQNNMVQGGEVDGVKLAMEGRMLRTDQYKYCVYNGGNHRESLVDMKSDGGESNNLAHDPGYRDVLLRHRELLARYGKAYNDDLVEKLLADDVRALPFALVKEVSQHKPVKEYSNTR